MLFFFNFVSNDLYKIYNRRYCHGIFTKTSRNLLSEPDDTIALKWKPLRLFVWWSGQLPNGQ